MGQYRGATQPVGEKLPNPFGLYDMLGNVWEWSWDRYDAYSGNVTDPVGSIGWDRVYRGCSWNFTAQGCRAAYRVDGSPVYRYNYLGFRPARSLP